MATRTLRSRKSISNENSPASSAGSNRNATVSSKEDSAAETEADDLPQIPEFGLSELAFSGAEVPSYSDDSINTSNVTTVKKKRIRNPPKEPVICPTCGKNFTRKAHLVRHMYLHTGEKPFKCNQCEQSFNRKDHLRSHVRGHSEMKEFPCNHCHCSFRRMDLLRVHVLKSHGKYQKTFKPATNLQKPSTSSSAIVGSGSGSGSQESRSSASPAVLGFKIHTCSLCGKKFTQTHLYNAHMATHGQNARNLAESHVSMSSVDDVEDEDSTEYQSTDNKEEGEGEEEEQEGLDDQEGEPSQESIIKQMLEKQDLPRKFECVVCAKLFKEQRSLRRHYKLHKRNFVCRFCGVKMSSAGSLMRHNLLHTGEKPFNCELCNRRFSRKDALKAHLAAHEKESSKVILARPYRCKQCPASYTMRYNLIRHMRQCHQSLQITAAATASNSQGLRQPQRLPSQIKRSFQSEAAVVSQLSLSAGGNLNDNGDPEDEDGNPLKCKHCGKIFANMKSLSTHYWYHNQEKRFVCKVCNHGFKYATDLNRHYMTHKGKRTTSLTQQVAQNRLAQARQYQQNVGQAQSQSQTQGQTQTQGIIQQRAAPTHNSIIVNGNRVYPCQVCGQIFNHRSNRSRHMRMFHKGNQVQPPSTSTQPPNLVRQVEVKAKPNFVRHFMPSGSAAAVQRRPVPQLTTQREMILAKQQQQLQQRQARLSIDSNDNEDEQPNFNGMWKCIHCGKVFDKRYNYKLHMRTHNKQYVCVVCGLRTASQGDLTLHIRTHTGEKPFKCTRCEWRFARRSALTVHYRRHHGPDAKIRRHYNPQRITPNMMNVNPTAVAQLVTTSSDMDVGRNAGEESMEDNSILKNMLENYPCKVELHEDDLDEEVEDIKPPPPPLQPKQLPKKNLPPPPPLIRYPLPSGSLSIKKEEPNTSTIVSEQKIAKVTFLCKPCDILIAGKDEYVNHMIEKHDTQVTVTSPRQGQTQNQTSSRPGLPHLQQRPTIQQARPPTFTCHHCQETLASKHDLTVHTLANHSQANDHVICGICRKVCSTLGFLSRHYQYAHPNARNAAEEARILMMDSHYDADQYQDDEEEYDEDNGVANDSSSAEQMLFPEVVIQEGNDEGEEEASTSYDMQGNLVHQLQGSEYGEEEEDDEDNGHSTSFDQLASNSSHETKGHSPSPTKQVFDPNLPYPCPTCNKCFKDKKALADHKWYHSREAIHPCTVCGKRFKLKNDLIRHLRRHLQERPHACPQEGCESRFYQKLDLDRHLAKVHNRLDSMPFPCQHCTSRFAQPATLIRHMRCSHPGQDISNALLLQMHEQKKKNEEKQMQEYLQNLAPEEEEQGEGEDEQGNDYSFELQQLEIDTANDEEMEEEEPEQDDLQVNDNSLDNGPPYKCETCGKVCDDRQKFIYHRYYHLREHRYECQHCEEKFKIKGHLDRHVRTYHNSERPVKQILECPVSDCRRKFSRDYDLNNHIQNVHKDQVTSDYNVETGNDDEEYETVTVPVEVNLQDVDDDIEDENEGEEGYYMDGDEDTEVQDMLQGSSTASSSSLLQPCMNKLEEYTNEDGELFCKPCNKKFSDLKTLQNHVYYHQREPKHPCDHCGAKFKQKSDLRRHISIHHDPNKKRACIPCPQCNRSFTDERYLRIHLNKNCEGRTDADDQFEDSFEIQEAEEGGDDASDQYGAGEDVSGQNQYLQEGWEEDPDPLMFVASDMQMETGEGEAEQYEEDDDDDNYEEDQGQQSVYECDICGAYFSRSNELILHKRSHANTAKVFQSPTATASLSAGKKMKTFSCDKCGMSFIQKGELTQHLQQYHIDELPVFTCQFCPKYFYVKKSLDTHRRRHHSHQMNLHPCSVCGAKFSQKEYLATHMKSHHTK